MAYREFTDPSGTVWQVWEVRIRPARSGEDRRKEARRHDSPLPHEPERRTGLERRMHEERRERPTLRVVSRLKSGWVCFECEREKRRLAPVPPGWEQFSDEELVRLLAEALPAAKRGS